MWIMAWVKSAKIDQYLMLGIQNALTADSALSSAGGGGGSSGGGDDDGSSDIGSSWWWWLAKFKK